MIKPTQLSETSLLSKSSPSSQPNQLGKLLMLASSNLPIGSYTYSQGLESAIVSGDVFDEASTQAWISDYLQFTLLGNELPIMAMVLALLAVDEHALSQAANQLALQVGKYHLASRETLEFERESEQMAHAFAAWIESVLGLNVPSNLQHQGFLPLFAHICHHEGLRPADTLLTYGFGQLENLVLVAVKSVPLGQMAGGRLLWQLQGELEASIDAVISLVNAQVTDIMQTWQAFDFAGLDDRELHNQLKNQLQQEALMLVGKVFTASSLPNLAIRSSEHECQYSRLYRS